MARAWSARAQRSPDAAKSEKKFSVPAGEQFARAVPGRRTSQAAAEGLTKAQGGRAG